MTQYRYRAMTPTGELLKGISDGATEADIAAQLQKRGALVLSITPSGRLMTLLSAEIGNGGALRSSELTEVTRELASMLSSGQDLDRSLRLMTEDATSKRVATVMGRVRDRVRNGTALAAALQREPKSFTRLYIGLVRAGEAGGTLGDTLERLAGLLERQRGMTAAIQSAMIYPAILVVAATGSIVLLLTQVLPQFVPLFAENGVALPPSTAFLLAVGQAFGNYGVLTLALSLAAGVALAALLRRPGPHRAADRLLLAVPVAGGILREILAARFARTLGMLLTNGVPLLAALGMTEEVVGNLLARDAVSQAARSAKSGEGLARSLAKTAVFPARLVHLLKLGEDTAQLGPLALRAADIHEERTRLGVQRVVALLVPAITICMGAAVAGIVSSLLLAMLSLNSIAQ